MTSVFVVQHVHVLDSGEEDAKMIGVRNARTMSSPLPDRMWRQG